MANYLPKLPDPDSVKDPKSAAAALSDAIAAVATANQTLSGAIPRRPARLLRGRLDRVSVPFDELKDWIKDFHKLLVKISAEHAEFTTWSVAVGTPFTLTLTVNFANRARVTTDSDFPVTTGPIPAVTQPEAR